MTNRNETVNSKGNIDIAKPGQKRKAADGFEQQKDAVLGWLDSDEDSDDERSDISSERSKTVYKVTDEESSKTFSTRETITLADTPKRSKFIMNGGRKHSENAVVDDKETLVNSVDDFIMSLQSQRKNVLL